MNGTGGVASDFTLHLLALTLLFPLGASAQTTNAPKLISDMDSVRHQAGEVLNKDQQKVPLGTVQLVEGKFGKAVQFSFTGGLGSGFMMASAPATADWDRAEGFSFYVKGDGSTNWAGLELIDKEDYGLRCGYCFPIDSTEWRKIVVRWRDLTPELAGPLVAAPQGYAPSRFGNLWFGKWFYWREYPAHSFAIDQIVLEEKIPPEIARGAWEPGLTRVQARLKAHQPITIVTLGDSLSDKRHWANQQLLWSEELARQLSEQCGSPVRLINPAIGGTTLSQNLVLMPRWLREAPSPDLVTIWFGFNDWDSGVRGARFKDYLRLAVERIRYQTHGSADVLLLTTSPAFSRWETMKEMEQAVREVAREQRTGLVDIAAAFRQAGSPEQALQQAYWAWDKTHLGTNGHKLVATALLKALYATP